MPKASGEGHAVSAVALALPALAEQALGQPSAHAERNVRLAPPEDTAADPWQACGDDALPDHHRRLAAETLLARRAEPPLGAVAL